MSLTSTIVFQNDKFIISQENNWFFIYEIYFGKLNLVYETTNEQDAVSYIVNNTEESQSA